MEVLFVLIALLVNVLALPLTIIGLIWFFFAARRLYREKKSLDAFEGNEAARAMTQDRLKASFIRALGLVLFPVVMVAVVFPTAHILGGGSVLAAFGAASMVSAAFRIWSGRIKKRYSGDFKENIVKAELSKVFSNLNYEPGQAFDSASIRSLGFFSSFDRFTGNDLIRADYQGLNFVQSDIGVEEQYTVTKTDSDGDTSTEVRWRDVFRGRAMRFDFADAFRGRVQVVSKDFDGAAVKQFQGEWQRVETELAEFGKHFEVYAPDPLDAMAALTPQMIEGIFYLKKALDVPTALYFTGNSMFVFMALTRNAFDVSGKHTLLEEVRFLERDIALMAGFMDVMYFRRQASAETADRSETAAAVAAAAGPSIAEKAVRKATRGMGMTLAFLPKLIIAVYVISAVYGFIYLPSEIAAGTSADAQIVPTIGYLIVSGVFIILSSGNIMISTICLAIYLLFMYVNL